MYANNCGVGISAGNNSLVDLHNYIHMNSIISIGVNASNNSIFNNNGGSSTNFNILNSNKGIALSKNSGANIIGAQMQNVNTGLIASSNSMFNLLDSSIAGPSDYTKVSYGVYGDGNSVGNVYGTSTTGFTTGTGSNTGAHYKATNNSVLFFDATGPSNLTNTQGTVIGYKVIDTSRGQNTNKPGGGGGGDIPIS